MKEQVRGREKYYSSRQNVPEFTSERDERLTILAHSCIRKVDRTGARERRESCAARPQEEGRHAASKTTRPASMGLAVENSKTGNTAAQPEVRQVSDMSVVSKMGNISVECCKTDYCCELL